MSPLSPGRNSVDVQNMPSKFASTASVSSAGVSHTTTNATLHSMRSYGKVASMFTRMGHHRSINMFALDILHTDRMLDMADGVSASDDAPAPPLADSQPSMSSEPSMHGSSCVNNTFSDTSGFQVTMVATKNSSQRGDAPHPCRMSSDSESEARGKSMQQQQTIQKLRATHEAALIGVEDLPPRTTCRRSTLGFLERPLESRAINGAHCLLYVYGIAQPYGNMGWSWYGRISPWIFLVLVACHVISSAGVRHFFYARLAIEIFVLNCLIGLCSLNASSVQRLLGPGTQVLTKCVEGEFLQLWHQKSLIAFSVVMFMWLTTVAIWIVLWQVDVECYDQQQQYSREAAIVSVLTPLLGSGLYAALTYFQLHVILNLELRVDLFGAGFFEQPDYCNAVQEWNKLQAIMRFAAKTIDVCFLATQSSVLAALVLMGVELLIGDGQIAPRCITAWAFSGLPCAVVALYTLFRAAAVSDKCAIVPAFINSYHVEQHPINAQRQYLVEYIQNSAAGFYVRGVRLTGFVAMKAAYLSGLVIFTFMMKAFNVDHA